jgi:hypothetical protein
MTVTNSAPAAAWAEIVSPQLALREGPKVGAPDISWLLCEDLLAPFELSRLAVRPFALRPLFASFDKCLAQEEAANGARQEREQLKSAGELQEVVLRETHTRGTIRVDMAQVAQPRDSSTHLADNGQVDFGAASQCDLDQKSVQLNSIVFDGQRTSDDAIGLKDVQGRKSSG